MSAFTNFSKLQKLCGTILNKVRGVLIIYLNNNCMLSLGACALLKSFRISEQAFIKKTWGCRARLLHGRYKRKQRLG